MVTTKAALGRNTSPPRIYVMLKPETVMRLTKLCDVAPLCDPPCFNRIVVVCYCV